MVRVLFYFKKEFRASYPMLELKATKGMSPSDVYVSSIFDKKVAITDFLGFDGDECIWQRWSEYAKNGHGGNIELKELLRENGEDYKYNF